MCRLDRLTCEQADARLTALVAYLTAPAPAAAMSAVTTIPGWLDAVVTGTKHASAEVGPESDGQWGMAAALDTIRHDVSVGAVITAMVTVSRRSYVSASAFHAALESSLPGGAIRWTCRELATTPSFASRYDPDGAVVVKLLRLASCGSSGGRWTSGMDVPYVDHRPDVPGVLAMLDTLVDVVDLLEETPTGIPVFEALVADRPCAPTADWILECAKVGVSLAS